MKKRKIIIIVIIILILVLIGLIIKLCFKPKRGITGNNYIIPKEVIELPNTVTYENEELSSKHCIDDICIDNAIFYYNDEEGRVEYTITNNSDEIKSGYLKMIFKDQELIIIYKDLLPKKTVNSRSQYIGMEIKDKSDYTLKKLSKEEIGKIIK